MWRVPTLLGVMAASALVLFAAGVLSVCAARRWPSVGVRAGTGVGLVLLAIGSGLGLSAAAVQVAHSLRIEPAHVAPGLLGYLAPVLFAALVFALGAWLLHGNWASRRALLFYVWLVGFTAANIINRCSPGWCEAIGFPFTWRSWSDVILTFGDGRVLAWLTAIGRGVGGAVNLAVFAAVAYALTRAGTSSRSG